MGYPLLPNGRTFDPKAWEWVAGKREPAKGRKYHSGWSIETIYRHKKTGELVTRHQIEKSDKIMHDHFRPGGLKIRP